MTKPKTAILWGRDDLLAQAMEFFLKAGEIWEVIRIPADQGICSVVEKVQRIKPDVVILYQGKYGDDSDPLMKLIQDQPELRAIADQPELKVIIVSLENNLMQVYSKYSIMVREASDLLSVIEDRYPPDHPV